MPLYWWVPFTFEALKKAFTTAPVLTHWIQTLKSRSKQTHPIMHSPLYFHYNSKWQTAPDCIPLLTFSTPESITISWQRATHDFWSLKDGTLSWRLCTSIECGHWSLECNLFHDQIPHTSASTWSEYLSAFNLIIRFWLENSVPNPMHSLARDVYLKEGKATMPGSITEIHPVFTSEQLASSLELLPYSIQPFVDLSSWMLKGSNSTLVSIREDPRRRTHQKSVRPQLDTRPRWSTMPPRTQYVPTLESSTTFFNIHMIFPLQVISVRQKHFTKSECTINWPGLPVTSKDYCKHVHLFPCQTRVPQTLWTSQATSDSQEPWNSISMDFIEKLPPSSVTPPFCHFSYQLTIHYVTPTCTTLRSPCLFKARCP